MPETNSQNDSLALLKGDQLQAPGKAAYFSEYAFDPGVMAEVDNMRYDLVNRKDRWTDYEKDFKEFQDYWANNKNRMMEEIKFEEYQWLWNTYRWEIETYGLVIDTAPNEKTTIHFKEQLVLTADTPHEALRSIPDVVKMLKEVHQELLDEDKTKEPENAPL